MAPRFSSEATEIVHGGCEDSRSEQMALIFEHDAVPRNRGVCWEDMNRNCGHCNRSLGTRIALQALGISAPVFETLKSLTEVESLRSGGLGEPACIKDNLQPAV